MTAAIGQQRPVAAPGRQKLGEMLIRKNIISADKVDRALMVQRERKKEGTLYLLGEILLELELVDEKTLYDVIRTIPPRPESGKEWGYLMMALRSSIGPDDSTMIDTVHGNNKTLHMLDVIHKNVESLSYKAQKRLIVSLFKPFVPNITVGAMEKITRNKDAAGKIRYFYEGKPAHIDFYPKMAITSQPQVIVSKMEYDNLTKKPDVSNGDSMGDFSAELPYSIHDLVSDACNQGASDIHIIPKPTDYYIAFRIHGAWILQKKYTLDLERGRRLLYAFKNLATETTMGGFHADDKRDIKDGRIELAETCGGIDLRVVILPTGSWVDEELVARIIRKTTLEKKALTELGFFVEDAHIIERAFRKRGGLFLTSGKTNSGKTTFNAQLLIRDVERKWETIEDPIEYVIPNPNICQHQTYMPKDGIKVGFAELVKGFKRGDPDGIMIGEIRKDEALIGAVVEAAHAGQLVLSTVHISSCFQVFRAMEEAFGVDYFTSASMILYSQNQTLVRALCDKCRVEDKDRINYKALNNIKDDLDYIVKDALEDFLANPVKTFIHNPTGCPECGGTGYKGRTPIYEYVYPDVRFRKWLLDEKPDRYAIEERACSGNRKAGVNKLQIFIKKLKAGIVDASPQTLEEIM